jgi:hypothetical protein
MSQQTVRNIAIVVALSLVVMLPAGGQVAGLLSLVLRVGLLAGFLYVGYVLWRENRHRLAWLTARDRLLLYGAVALIALLLLAGFAWPIAGAVGALAYLGLLGGLSYLVWRILQETRRYY